MSDVETTLSQTEQAELSAAEKVISAGLQSFRDVGMAFIRVRDGKLYRGSFKTFEAYCQIKWGYSRARAYQLCEAAETVEAMSTKVDNLPQAEKQVRPLNKLPEEKRVEAWNNANEIAKNEGRAVTARDVEKAVDNLASGGVESRHANGSQSKSDAESVTKPSTLEAGVAPGPLANPISNQFANAFGFKDVGELTAHQTEIQKRWKSELTEFLSQNHISVDFRISLLTEIASDAWEKESVENLTQLHQALNKIAMNMRIAALEAAKKPTQQAA